MTSVVEALEIIKRGVAEIIIEDEEKLRLKGVYFNLGFLLR